MPISRGNFLQELTKITANPATQQRNLADNGSILAKSKSLHLAIASYQFSRMIQKRSGIVLNATRRSRLTFEIMKQNGSAMFGDAVLKSISNTALLKITFEASFRPNNELGTLLSQSSCHFHLRRQRAAITYGRLRN